MTSVTKREIASQERRTHILTAATSCFVDNGFHQTGMREIAKRAEISLGNLYNYFPSKHALLVAFADQEAAQTEPFISQLHRDIPADERLETFIQLYCKECCDQDAVILTLDIAAEAMRQPDIAHRFLDGRSALATALSAVIASGVQEKCFNQIMNDLDMANLVLDLIENAVARGVIEGVNPHDLSTNIQTLVFAALKP